MRLSTALATAPVMFGTDVALISVLPLLQKNGDWSSGALCIRTVRSANAASPAKDRMMKHFEHVAIVVGL